MRRRRSPQPSIKFPSPSPSPCGRGKHASGTAVWVKARTTVAFKPRDGVESRYGAAVLPIHIDAAAKPGEVFATFADPAVFLNRVTGPWRDARTDTPEYKVTAVRLTRA